MTGSCPIYNFHPPYLAVLFPTYFTGQLEKFIGYKSKKMFMERFRHSTSICKADLNKMPLFTKNICSRQYFGGEFGVLRIRAILGNPVSSLRLNL